MKFENHGSAKLNTCIIHAPEGLTQSRHLFKAENRSPVPVTTLYWVREGVLNGVRLDVFFTIFNIGSKHSFTQFG